MSDKALVPPAGVKPLTGMNDRQIAHIRSILKNSQTIVLGPAGTGKTYVSVVSGCNLLLSGKISQMIFSRPMVGPERMGFLPGDEKEKIAPWFTPIYDILVQRLGSGNVQRLMKDGVIRVEPFEFMLGKTFYNAFVMLDEAQNTTRPQIQCLVTRLGGEDSILVVDGDIRQKYLKETSGLGYLVNLVEDENLQDSGIGLIEYFPDDVVRGPICKMWVKLFEKDYHQG